MAAGDEGLVELVGDGEGGRQRDRGRNASHGAEDQRAEDGVFDGMRELAQDDVPGSEPRAQVRDRREREDDGGPENHRDQRVDAGCRHRPSVVPRRGDAREERSSRSI